MKYEKLAQQYYNAYATFTEKGIYSDYFNEVEEVCVSNDIGAGLEMLKALAGVKIPQEHTALPVEVINHKRSLYFAFVGAGPAKTGWRNIRQKP